MISLIKYVVFVVCVTQLKAASHGKFPKDFKFGAATSAYQIEGAYNESGKGWSVWDVLTHMNPNIILEKKNADVACDSYHKYKEDVQLIKQLGLDMYRFSISWPRIMPKGTPDQINQAGVDYYHNLIDELLANGIEPMVTMYHWDLPQYFQNFGGWLNENLVDHFMNYADFLFQTYGYKVKWWITINELFSTALSYGGKTFAPALNLHGTGDYIALHNQLKAHAKAYRLYQSKYKYQNGKLSASFVAFSCLPKTNSAEDIAATERCFEFNYGWGLHPIYSDTGDYPRIMKTQIEKFSKRQGVPSRLPKFSKEEIEEIKGSYDFLALHYYSAYLVSNGVDPTAQIPSRELDSETIMGVDPSWPAEPNGLFYVNPKGFKALLKWVKKQYNNPIIFITEMGFVDTGGIDDNGRIEYLDSHFDVIKEAIQDDNMNITGLVVWSLIDTFEWNAGYSGPLGLIHVDFNDPDRTRTLKKSALWYKSYIEENRY